MQQKLEAGVVTQYYPTLNEELQSRTKEQLQRYASTYLGIDPKTVDVTLPWQRLFEVYVDVKPARQSPGSDVRHDMNSRELQSLANEVSEAQAKLDASRTVNDDGTVSQADPAVQAQLQAAKAAAQARYEQEKQAQAINHSEEKAQQSRTWLHRNKRAYGTTETDNDTTSSGTTRSPQKKGRRIVAVLAGLICLGAAAVAYGYSARISSCPIRAATSMSAAT